MVARLSRIVPMLLVLAVIAAIIYLVAMYKYSPNRAKEILIKVFTWFTGGLSVFFILASLYAWFDNSMVVFDLTMSFLATSLVGLIITRLCHRAFVRHHPHYKNKPVKTTRVDDHPRKPFTPPWKR